jgi:hypothetical protein
VNGLETGDSHKMTGSKGSGGKKAGKPPQICKELLKFQTKASFSNQETYLTFRDSEKPNSPLAIHSTKGNSGLNSQFQLNIQPSQPILVIRELELDSPAYAEKTAALNLLLSSWQILPLRSLLRCISSGVSLNHSNLPCLEGQILADIYYPSLHLPAPSDVEKENNPTPPSTQLEKPPTRSRASRVASDVTRSAEISSPRRISAQYKKSHVSR